MTNAVEFDSVSIVFGDAPQRALPLMDQGKSRAEVQAATGQILGVHDCSLTVAEGEILVLMGLSGSGKSTLLRGVNALNPVVRGEVRVLDGDVEGRVWEVEGLEAVYAAAQAAADWPGGVGEGARFAVAQWGEGYGWGAEAVVRL